MRLAHTEESFTDLKPQNILLTPDSTAKVTDFGITVAFAETSLTLYKLDAGFLIHYLSPERVVLKRPSRVISMLWGYLLGEMLTGHIPYDGDSAVTVFHFQ